MFNYREIIKRRRISLGISQNQLSKLVGITQAFMNEIESGRKSPSIEVLFKICEILDIKLFPDDGE